MATRRARPGKAPAQKRKQHQRPTETYETMIAAAIQASGGKETLDGIYRHISMSHPFFSSAKDGWKGCVRHNLSSKPQFIKSYRGPIRVGQKGKGHFWIFDASRKKGSPPSQKVKAKKPATKLAAKETEPEVKQATTAAQRRRQRAGLRPQAEIKELRRVAMASVPPRKKAAPPPLRLQEVDKTESGGEDLDVTDLISPMSPLPFLSNLGFGSEDARLDRLGSDEAHVAATTFLNMAQLPTDLELGLMTEPSLGMGIYGNIVAPGSIATSVARVESGCHGGTAASSAGRGGRTAAGTLVLEVDRLLSGGGGLVLGGVLGGDIDGDSPADVSVLATAGHHGQLQEPSAVQIVANAARQLNTADPVRGAMRLAELVRTIGRWAFFTSTGLPAIVAAAQSATVSSEAKQILSYTLAALAADQAHHPAFVAMGGLTALLALCKSGSAGAKANAAFGVSELAKSSDERPGIVRAGAVAELIGVVQTASPLATAMAAAAFAELASTPTLAPSLLPAVPALVSGCKCTTSQGQRSIISTLAELTRVPEIRNDFVRCGAVQLLAAALGHAGCREVALAGIDRLSHGGSEIAAGMVGSGVLNALDTVIAGAAGGLAGLRFAASARDIAARIRQWRLPQPSNTLPATVLVG